MYGAFAQAGPGIAHVSFRIEKVSFVSINIDCRSFCLHLNCSPLLPICWLSRTVARPIVTSLFELESEFFPPASNDSPRYHHMDVIRDDVVQEALIVRDK